MRRVLPAAPLLLVSWLAACAPEGPTAFVTFNVVPDQNCAVSPSTGGGKFYPIGRYDIGPGVDNVCAHPYVVNLLVNSYLRPNANEMLGRSEPNILQLHSAQVRLMTIQKQTLLFNQVKPPLPNPFLVTTNNSLFPATGSTPSTGIAAIEAIPKAYAPYLSMFKDGGQILAEIQIFGTTTGDVDIKFKPFIYPIEICDSCLHLCAADIAKAMKTRMEIVKDRCDDNSGSDDRVCIDPGC
jgi:hypothetical protein